MDALVVDWSTAPERQIIAGFLGRFAHSERMTFVLWAIDAGAVLPEHAHPHEQVAHVHDGRFEMTVDGRTHVLGPGMVGVIPANARHSGRALTDCRILDVFAPVREDYRDGVKTVLQQAAEAAR